MHYKEGVKPLFHRVVIESGAPTSRAVRPYYAEVHEAQFRDFLDAVDCPRDLADAETLPYLRSIPYDKICAAQTAVFDKYNPSLGWAFQPVIDYEIIARPPIQTWISGKWHNVPIMTGFTHNEGSLYVNKQLNTSEGFNSFFANLIPLLDESEIDAIRDLYPDPMTDTESPYKENRAGVGAQYKRVEAAYANYAYQAPVRQTVDFASRAGVPVYLYQWALETSILEGARHADNMRYEACDPSVMKISATQATISRILNAYITSFIANGDPNACDLGDDGDFLPRWEPSVPDGPRAMVFGEENKELVGGEAANPVKFAPDIWARRESEFWWTKVDKSQQ